MIISFSNVPLVISCAVGALILVLHIASAFIDGVIGRMATPVSIALHLALITLLFFAGAEFDLLVTVIMASVLCYCGANYVSYTLKKGKEADS